MEIVEKILPSVDDNTGDLHKPSIMANIFWDYGYIDVFDKPISRKHKITGKIEVRRYNQTFQYWGWMEVKSKYKSQFVIKKYWS